jgi:DNA-binding winged helix-turn-helix (wHTH) protein
MTGSALSTASTYSPFAGVPALARFPLEEVDTRSALQGSDTYQLLFRKRTNPAVPAAPEIAFRSFCLLPARFLLLEDDKPVHLGSRALQILVVLLERAGELVSKQQLMSRVWPNIFVEPTNLRVHISALRRTLRDGRDSNRFIINVPGRGYSFVAPVQVRHDADAGVERAAGPLPDGWLRGRRVEWEDQVRSSDRQKALREDLWR